MAGSYLWLFSRGRACCRDQAPHRGLLGKGATSFCMRSASFAGMMALCLMMAGCLGSREQTVPPDQQFGHRYEGEGPEGRAVVHIDPIDSETDYHYYPAPVDTLHVRPAAYEMNAAGEPTTRLELLIKGAFPNGCYRLHEVEEERAGHILNIDLVMRKPKDALCPNAQRPYRFYYVVDGQFTPGAYVIKLNALNFTFNLQEPAS